MTKLPAKMRAVEIAQPGGPEVLTAVERALPTLRAGEILVKVAAAGVNRPDVLQRMGNYAPPPDASDLPGLEIAGEVVACGDGVTQWKPGDRVCALAPGGGYAEYCTVPAVQALPIPKGLSAIEAASLPETFYTVWNNVYDRAKLAAGESLLASLPAVLKNRKGMLSIWGYTAHNWELLGLWAWLPAYLTAAFMAGGDSATVAAAAGLSLGAITYVANIGGSIVGGTGSIAVAGAALIRRRCAGSSRRRSSWAGRRSR